MRVSGGGLSGVSGKGGLHLRGIPFVAQQELRLCYKGSLMEQTYKPDIICHGTIILELKSVKEIAPEHQAQMHNYLRATGHRLGLIINFGHHPKVEIQRIAREGMQMNLPKRIMGRTDRDGCPLQGDNAWIARGDKLSSQNIITGSNHILFHIQIRRPVFPLS
jgi:GxxExxY protein